MIMELTAYWEGGYRVRCPVRGFEVVADESTLAEAHQIARQATPIPVSATGSAGLAGLAVLARSGAIAAGERALVLFTGVQR